jgi:uncharacterized protein (DUF1800 family)
MASFPKLRRRDWQRQTAAHLAVRAGFGPTPLQLARMSQMTLDEAVEAMLDYPAEGAQNFTPPWFLEDQAINRLPNGLTRKAFQALDREQRNALQQEQRKEHRQQLESTRAWWLERMVNSPNPLEEKLTLFWHGHFATSIQKVQAPYPMLLQNLSFREKGRGSWRDLILAVSQDPAMLVYLDNARSSKAKPNENYARELMELFTLGEGNYSEDDIRNAARAFAGWSINGERWEFEARERQMDTGRKIFMTEDGRLGGEDIINIIVKQPRAADFLAERLWNFFASESPNKGAMADISRSLRDSNFDVKTALRVLFTHEDFYHPSVIRSQIKSPVQLSVHLVRTLNAVSPPGKIMANACRQLGQQLFEPPSVKGWDGGAAWITASNLSLRYQLAGKLIEMKNAFHPDTLLPDRNLSREKIRVQLFDRFYHSPLREQEQQTMDRYLAALPPATDWQRKEFIQVLQHLVQQPQFQLT